MGHDGRVAVYFCKRMDEWLFDVFGCEFGNGFAQIDDAAADAFHAMFLQFCLIDGEIMHHFFAIGFDEDGAMVQVVVAF